MTSREPMEPIDDEAGDLVNLEDVPGSEHNHGCVAHTEEANEGNLEQRADHEEPLLPDLLLD